MWRLKGRGKVEGGRGGSDTDHNGHRVSCTVPSVYADIRMRCYAEDVLMSISYMPPALHFLTTQLAMR